MVTKEQREMHMIEDRERENDGEEIWIESKHYAVVRDWYGGANYSSEYKQRLRRAIEEVRKRRSNTSEKL